MSASFNVAALVILAVTVIFSSGVLWAKVNALQKAVMNGISSRLKDQEKKVSEQAASMAAMTARCESHREWTKDISADVKHLQEAD